MNLKTVIGIPVVAVLFFFGLVFAMASSVEQAATRLVVAAVCFVLGFGILYYVTRRPPAPIVQKLEMSGDMKAVALKCPNCSATVDASRIRILSGVAYATCPYCGHSFEVAEEPKW